MIKIFNKFSKPQLILFTIIFLIGIFTRFYNIQKIPTFIYQDEMGYIISAIALNYSNSDIVGTWNPMSLTPVISSIAALAELTTQFIAPFTLLPINLIVASKLIFLLFSLIIPFFISGITWELTKSKTASFWAWIISLFNPWIWQVGRMSLDPYISFSLYIIAAYLILRLKNWKKLWSLPILFAGFYNYQGHKLVFIFWVFIFTLYSIFPYIRKSTTFKSFLINIKNIKILPSFIVLMTSLFILFFYMFVQLPNQASSERLNSFFTPSSSEIATKVNKQRRLSLDTGINSTIINKYTVWSGDVFERLVDTYSFKYLFLQGQGGNAPFSVWNHGLFYAIESILILLGIYHLLNKKRYGLLFLLLFSLVVTVIPSLISQSKAYFFRSSLNIPILIVFAALGIDYLKIKLPKYLFYLIPIIYIVSISYFAFLYFVRYPILSSERQYFSDRVLTEYLKRVSKDQEVIVISSEIEFSVETFLFYSDYLNKDNIGDIQKQFQVRKYQIDNIQFTNSCVPEDINKANELVISRWDIRRCNSGEDNIFTFDDSREYFSNSLQIKNIKDGGTVFDIYNDQLCSGLEINPYLNIRSLDSFNFDEMSDKEFCQTWISKLID